MSNSLVQIMLDNGRNVSTNLLVIIKSDTVDLVESVFENLQNSLRYTHV